ncbi:hypothetical protein GCM10029978_037060 [Actinoallomurus acanthiterrae]
MTDSANIAVARKMYEAKGDPAVLAEVMDTDVVWDITPGFPGGGVYQGFASVGQDFLAPLGAQFESLHAVAEEYFADNEDHVFVLGHYHGVTNAEKTVDIRFIHLWTVHDGKLVHLWQAADSLVLDRALND